jgi:6-pyruvoyltetrahydropterin/6-carboxytetrahydropterin synthase
MRSITKLNIQYAHRFLNYEGEAQYLHGHTGLLTIEVDGDVDGRTGFVYPCNSIKRIAWDLLKILIMP